MPTRKWVLLVAGAIVLGIAIFAYKREATGTQSGPVCGPTEYECACTTGHYCLARGALCLTPTSACPAQ